MKVRIHMVLMYHNLREDIPGCENEVQQIKNPTIAVTSSRKRKKSTIDKYVASRTSQGAQPSIKSVLVGK